MSEHIVIGGKKYLILKTGLSSNTPGSPSPVIKFKEKKPWNTQQTFELIRLYREKPELYDTTHNDYLSRASRRKAYRYISQGLSDIRPNTSEEEIRTKWNSLRTQFMREYSKGKKAAEDGVPFKPGMLFYESLMFLKDSDGSTKRDVIILDEPEISINEDSTEFKLPIEYEESKDEDCNESEELGASKIKSITEHGEDKVVKKEPEESSDTPPAAKRAKEVKKDKNIFALVVDPNQVKPQKKTFNTTIIPRAILPAPTGNFASSPSTPSRSIDGRPFDGLCQYIGETLRSLPIGQARKLEQRLLTSMITFMSNLNDT
ncbi:unnamed protein product [Bemisia tabaci]|uniref:MADF domain-containing protein n=1 Tax=Bemisia tabaci TaxID=7038 RepID=A0A9P0AF14_BEMTA|nr:unnamed protein product [Bemisia tabaci]